MAITRCPYCHAIIDEADKYCNNCGTQLLFSEDEQVEEEIPGEKIIDAEVEDKDYTIDEPESEKRPASRKDLDTEIDEELEDALPEGAGKTAIEELMAGEELDDAEEAEENAGEEEPAGEVILVDEIEASEAADKDARLKASAPLAGPAGEEGEEEPEGEDEDERGPVEEEVEEKAAGEKATEAKAEAAEEEDEEAEEEEIADELEEDLEGELEEPTALELATAAASVKDDTRDYGKPVTPQAPEEKAPGTSIRPPDEPEIDALEDAGVPDDTGTAGEASLRPATFDSQELENLGRTVDLSREKIDKFIQVMAEKTPETGPIPAVPAPEPAVEPEPAPGPEKRPEPPTGTLPPWASTMKGAPVFPEDTGPVEPKKVRGESAMPDTDEVEIFPRRRGEDSTMGLPEKLSQAPLPFEKPAAEEEEETEEEEELAAEVERDEAQGEDLPEEPAGGAAAEAPAVEETPVGEGPARPPLEPILPTRRPESGRLARTEILPTGETEEAEPRPPFSVAVFFKSKVFDLLFVGVFWLVALWLAASSMGVTLFDILGTMSASMLLLYAVFVLLYFFLFKFFLGETLGDRLFRRREQE